MTPKKQALLKAAQAAHLAANAAALDADNADNAVKYAMSDLEHAYEENTDAAYAAAIDALTTARAAFAKYAVARDALLVAAKAYNPRKGAP